MGEAAAVVDIFSDGMADALAKEARVGDRVFFPLLLRLMDHTAGAIRKLGER
jgi:hypothetical protein